uniref:Uncharacterized protein n=1 Tax=Branchiostoma floridae TaxID=7739 RepID=C3ZAC3_BRAFL|eukprot:XP_002594505.1 hypothetical protein BRAFLDRAFT_87698 [Branchiostoma floridae]
MTMKFALCVLLVSMAVLSTEAWPRRGGFGRQYQPSGNLDGAGYGGDSDPGALPEGDPNPRPRPQPGRGRRGPPPHVAERLVDMLQRLFEGREMPEGIERLLQRLLGLRPERPGAGGSDPERPGPGGRPERPGPGGRPERPGPGGRPERPGPGSRPERPGPGDRPEYPGAGDRPDMPENGGRPEVPETDGRPEVPESHGPDEYPNTDFGDAPFFFP